MNKNVEGNFIFDITPTKLANEVATHRKMQIEWKGLTPSRFAEKTGASGIERNRRVSQITRSYFTVLISSSNDIPNNLNNTIYAVYGDRWCT